MQNIWKIFEYGYLIIAIAFGVETALKWNEDRERAYLLAGFTILAIFIYFLRRRFRKKRETPNN
ncbi:MAG: LPXTG cell wall anchor domain-containing protein [Flavobacteriaceae bacterium]|nr:LPXTG cell wall anchor domain-containing protein [Flavobacteriaceae bacterium]